MKEGDHFYVTLPSNSSEAFYGRQSPSKYITKLATPISLDPELWEVGLAELTYPATWPNIPTSKFNIVRQVGGVRESVQGSMAEARFVSSKHYVRELDRAVQRALGHDEDHKGTITVRYDDTADTARVKLQPTEDQVMVLPAEIAGPLGFGDHRTAFRSERLPIPESTDRIGRIGRAARPTVKTILGPYEKPKKVFYTGQVSDAPYRVNVNRALPSLYIYCDLVQHQRVGDASVPLLRHVAHRNKVEDELVVVPFSNVHYAGLARGTFETIEVHIADHTGGQVPFRYGHVIVKLHFRRKRP